MGPIFNEKVAICPLKCLLQQRKKKRKGKTQETQCVSKQILGVRLDTTYFC